MTSPRDNRMELRRYPRRVIVKPCLLSFSPFSLSLTVSEAAEGEGMVVDLSPSGCRVQSEVVVRVSEAMSLILLLPDHQGPTTVDLAMVRWVGDDKFGLEFISVGATESSRILGFLSDIDKSLAGVPKEE